MNEIIHDLKFALHNPKLMLRLIWDMRDELSYYSILREIFLHQAYLWLISNLKPDTVAIDIGSFRGESAIYLASSDNVKKVIALDSSLSSCILAKRQADASQLSRKIEFINKAVTSVPCLMSNDGNTSHNIPRRGNGMMSITLEQLIKKANSSKIIIKCDIEGAELDIFNCKREALKNVYKLQIECHDTIPQILKIMSNFGFKTKVLESYEDAFYNKVFYDQVGYVLAWK